MTQRRSRDGLALVSPHYHQNLRATLGTCMCPNAVEPLPDRMGYSLHVNERRHLPIIGVDTKKRELVSKFRNVAHRWECSPAAPLTTASVPTPWASPLVGPRARQFHRTCRRSGLGWKMCVE